MAFRETAVEKPGGLETAGEPLLGVAVADSEHTILGFTSGFAGIIGCGEEELRGKEWLSLLFSDRGLREHILKEISDKGECSGRGWLKGKRKGSRFIFFSAKGYELNGKRFYAIALQDITGWERLRRDAKELQGCLGKMRRLVTVGILAGGVVHAVAQALNAIKILAEGMLYMMKQERGLPPERIAENLKRISGQLGRISGLLDRFYSFADSDSEEEGDPACDLNEVLVCALELMKGWMESCGISVRSELAPDLPRVRVRERELQDAVVILLAQLLEAMKEGGWEEKEIRCFTRAEGEHVVVELSGSFLALGEPFDEDCCQKEERVGLALAREIVEEGFGGSLEVFGEPPGMVAYRMRLAPVSGGEGGDPR
ncbi:MAG: sensor histidine kinase [Thermacetogeniaceae bacterium]